MPSQRSTRRLLRQQSLLDQLRGRVLHAVVIRARRHFLSRSLTSPSLCQACGDGFPFIARAVAVHINVRRRGHPAAPSWCRRKPRKRFPVRRAGPDPPGAGTRSRLPTDRQSPGRAPPPRFAFEPALFLSTNPTHRHLLDVGAIFFSTHSSSRSMSASKIPPRSRVWLTRSGREICPASKWLTPRIS